MAILELAPGRAQEDAPTRDRIPPVEALRTVFVANGHLLSSEDRQLLLDAGIKAVDAPPGYLAGDTIHFDEEGQPLSAQRSLAAVAAQKTFQEAA